MISTQLDDSLFIFFFFFGSELLGLPEASSPRDKLTAFFGPQLVFSSPSFFRMPRSRLKQLRLVWVPMLTKLMEGLRVLTAIPASTLGRVEIFRLTRTWMLSE